MNKAAFVLVGSLLLSACSEPSSNSPAANEANEQLAISVQVSPVQRQNLQAWIYSQGTARAKRREFLSFTDAGRVTYLDENLSVGSPVKKGQLIAHQTQNRVEADVSAAQAGIKEAEANYQLAQVNVRRYQTLLEQRSASALELDQARVQLEQANAGRDQARTQLAQAKINFEDSRLISPIDGVLARLNIERGRYFNPQLVQTSSEQGALRTVPALVIDPSLFEVRIDLPSYYFSDIEVGARALVGSNPPSSGGEQLDPNTFAKQVEAVVYAISPSLDPENRTFEVILHTKNPNPRLQDGEFIAAWIAKAEQNQALTVPLEALRHRNDQSFVFVYLPERQRVIERRIELGQYSGPFASIISGLEEGEQVVTDGRAKLNDGQRVQVLGTSEKPQ